MTSRSTLALLALLAFPAAGAAQHSAAAPAPPPAAPREATQFDFLIGQWELVVRLPAQGLAQRIHGAPRMAGTWKAWRALDGWGIEDELRIVDRGGATRSLSHAVRVFDPSARRWNTSMLDVFRAKFSTSTAEWQNGEMRISGRGADLEGRAFVSRTRIYAITPTSFTFQQDRSTDDGRTWAPNLTIEATRVAAAAPR